MVYQLRIYTINRGMMDSWLKVFNEHIPAPARQTGHPGGKFLGQRRPYRVHLGASFQQHR